MDLWESESRESEAVKTDAHHLRLLVEVGLVFIVEFEKVVRLKGNRN